MGKIFAVTSGKGGVGKSTVSVGLALSFTKMGKNVLLIDVDEGLRCLDVMLGLDEQVVFDLSDILLGGEFSNSVYYSEQNPLLHLIPAPSELGKISPSQFKEFAEKIHPFYDVVIFDFPAGIDFSLYDTLPKETLFLTVAFPDPVTLRDASIVSQKLNDIGITSRLIINAFDYSLTKRKIYSNIDDIIDKANLQLLGIVPKDKELSLLSVKHKLKNGGKAMSAFLRIAKRLLGENVLLPKLKKI